jgi:hypothetical protein
MIIIKKKRKEIKCSIEVRTIQLRKEKKRNE